MDEGTGEGSFKLLNKKSKPTSVMKVRTFGLSEASMKGDGGREAKGEG